MICILEYYAYIYQETGIRKSVAGLAVEQDIGLLALSTLGAQRLLDMLLVVVPVVVSSKIERT